MRKKKGNGHSRQRVAKHERIGDHSPVSRIISEQTRTPRKYKCLACRVSGTKAELKRTECGAAKRPVPDDVA